MKIYRRPWTRCQIATGALIAAIGIFLVVFVPIKLKSMIYDTFSLATPSSSFVEDFIKKDPKSASVYNSYYLYHVENPTEVELSGADPILVEKGPYTYRQDLLHLAKEFAWRADGTLEYIERCVYVFDRSRSVGDESDMLTTVNLGYVGALHQSRDDPDLNGAVRGAINLIKAPLFMNLTVGEVLWGYENALLKILSIAKPDINPIISLQTRDDLNDTTLLPWAVVSGAKSAEGFYQYGKDDLRQITMWQGRKGRGVFWNSSYANMYNGTDGTTFHPYFFDEDAEPYVFVDSLFRSMRLARCGSKKKDGVKLYCLTLRDDQLLSGEHNPDNVAFYMKNSGFLPLPPAVGQPIYISLPHFHRANWSDPLANKIKFVPDNHESDRYDTRLFVEPFTGQLMEAHKRLQINTFLEPGITTTNPNTTHTYFPIAWIDQYPDIPDSTISKFKLMVYLPFFGSIVGGSVFIAVGLGLIIVAVVRCTCWVSAAQKAQADMHYGHEYRSISRGESHMLGTVNNGN